MDDIWSSELVMKLQPGEIFTVNLFPARLLLIVWVNTYQPILFIQAFDLLDVQQFWVLYQMASLHCT